jgi:hypothetical protein
MPKYEVLARFSIDVHTMVEAENSDDADDIARDRDPDLFDGDENTSWVLSMDSINDGRLSQVEVQVTPDDLKPEDD